MDKTESMPKEPSAISSIIFKTLSIIWVALIIPDYIYNHPYIGKSFGNFGYFGFLLFALLLVGGFTFWKMEKGGDILKSFSIKITGWQIVTMSLLSTFVLYTLFHQKIIEEGSPFSAGLRMVGTGFVFSLGFFWLLVSAFATGYFPLQKIKERFHPVSFQVISMALGLSIQVTIAAIIGQFGILNPYVLWVITIIPVAIFHKIVLDFLQSLFLRPVTYKKLNLPKLGLLFVFLIFIAANFISALKPFPIGFDGSGLYMNTSSLIAGYQALPQGGQAYNWSLFMSFGELMFGSTTVGIMVSHFTLFLVIATIYRTARLVMSPSRSWVATLIFFVLPSVVYQTVREEKTDFGLAFITLATFLLLLEYKKSSDDENSKNNSFWVWGLAGWLMGFAFGIKALAIYGIVALGTLWAYRQFGKFGAWGTLSLATCFLFIGGLEQLSYMELTPSESFWTKIITGGIGLICLAFALIKEKRKFEMTSFAKIGIFILILILPILPWAVKNTMEQGHVSMSTILNGKDPKPNTHFPLKIFADPQDLNPLKAKRENAIIQELDSLPPRNYQQGKNNPNQKKKKGISQAEREEIKRYIGYEKGFPLYFSIPYDATTGKNIPGRSFVDISFLFLLLIPLLFLRRNKKGWIPNSIYAGLFLPSVLILSWYSHYYTGNDFSSIEHALNIQNSAWGEGSSFASFWSGIISGIMGISQPIYSNLYQALSNLGFISVLFFIVGINILFYFLFRNKFREWPSELKEIGLLFYSSFILWLISANNIPWYGFSSMALLGIILAYPLQNTNWWGGEKHSKFGTFLFSICIGLFLLICSILRLSDPEQKDKYSSAFVDRVFIQQAAFGKDKRDILHLLTPSYNTAVDELNKNLSGKIYRVGTYLNYHIQNNDKRVLEDNQLKVFESFIRRVHEPGRFIQFLKENGFTHIIYDINTPSIDKTPEQSLAKRADLFIRLLSQHPGIKIKATDRIVKSKNPSDFVTEQGKTIQQAKYGLLGPEIKTGSFIVFEIL